MSVRVRPIELLPAKSVFRIDYVQLTDFLAEGLSTNLS